MTGFATVVATIRGDLNRGSDFDTRIKKAIDSAIRYYRARRYQFNTRRKPLSISTEYLSFSSDIIEVDYFKIVNTLNDYQKSLGARNYLEINKLMRSVSDTGEPIYYGRDKDEFRFYPPPDRSYSAEVHFLEDLREVSACASDSASNGWLVQGEELIRVHAMIEILELYIGGDDANGQADRLRGRVAQVDAELKRRANKSQGSGKVKGFI